MLERIIGCDPLWESEIHQHPVLIINEIGRVFIGDFTKDVEFLSADMIRECNGIVYNG